MGNIRGTHSSPGVYTKMTDKKQIRTRISLIANKNEDVSNISIGGGSSSKTNVTINGNVVEENGLYYVVLNAKPAVLDDITISMDINDEPKQVTMKKGSVEEKIETDDKYCKIENVTVEPQSTSVAKYSVNKVINPNGDGLFNVSVINVINNEETLISTKQHKYKSTVDITAKDIEGYEFIKWKLEGQEYTNDTISFIMPENDVEVRCYYNIKTFTITWKNDDDDNTVLTSTTVNYGVKPEYPNEDPSKVSTEKYNYTFKGWTPSITEAKEDKTYTAEYLSEIRKYEIIFVNEDGTELLRTDVEYDTIPSYNGPVPTKEQTDEFTYTFIGWNPAITTVTGDTEYTAQFEQSTNTYTVTWKNHDGTVLETDTGVTYDTIPTYDGPEPTREADEKYTYTFNGWTPTITAATSNATYTANFDKVEKPTTNSSVYYSMPFVNELKNLDENKILEKFSSFEYNDSTLEYDIKPTIPFLDNDDVWNEFYDNGDDASIWEEHGYVFCIAIPSSVLDTHEVVYTEDGQHPVTLIFKKELTINNTNYDVYASSAGEPSDPYYGTDNPIVLNDAKIIFSKQ